MTAPARDIQQDAEAFIMQTLARRGPCTAFDLVRALKTAKRPEQWVMYLGKLKERRLVAQVVTPDAITYELTRRGKQEVE